jgi:hypothetical protein
MSNGSQRGQDINLDPEHRREAEPGRLRVDTEMVCTAKAMRG